MLENWDNVYIDGGHEAMTRKIPNDKLQLITRISRLRIPLEHNIMASFQVFFSTFFFFLLPHISSAAVICQTTSCDDIVPVKFPFRLKSSQNRSCGYPGFDLSCDNISRTILSFPKSGDSVVVQHIDYSDQSIYISDPDRCFPGRFMRNFTDSVSPNFLFDSLENFTFFNCSSSNATMTSDFLYMPIDCLSGDEYTVWIAQTVYMEAFPPPATCRAISTAMFPYLRYGIVRLIWGKPSCGGCVASGGDCALVSSASPDVGCFNVPSNG
ncbi:putative RING-H2 finger protein ATL21B [Corylus avellana]|uniref:putative RING-H2 finger protein ATL21B n=1 Tax=Corylus avellana TaxID=13451 RepID=UPI00286A71F8|nr:putative RING-H2 finger protein ATL21B [Corylus avellana]